MNSSIVFRALVLLVFFYYVTIISIIAANKDYFSGTSSYWLPALSVIMLAILRVTSYMIIIISIIMALIYAIPFSSFKKLIIVYFRIIYASSLTTSSLLQ